MKDERILLGCIFSAIQTPLWSFWNKSGFYQGCVICWVLARFQWNVHSALILFCQVFACFFCFQVHASERQSVWVAVDRSVLSLLQTAAAASFSGLVSLCPGISKFLLHHRSTEENQATLWHIILEVVELGCRRWWVLLGCLLQVLNLISTTDGSCLICKQMQVWQHVSGVKGSAFSKESKYKLVRLLSSAC